MKKQGLKRALSVMLCLIVAVTAVGVSPTNSYAKSKIRFNKTELTLSVNDVRFLFVNGMPIKSKAKFKIADDNIATVSNDGNSSVKVVGKNVGSTTIVGTIKYSTKVKKGKKSVTKKKTSTIKATITVTEAAMVEETLTAPSYKGKYFEITEQKQFDRYQSIKVKNLTSVSRRIYIDTKYYDVNGNVIANGSRSASELVGNGREAHVILCTPLDGAQNPIQYSSISATITGQKDTDDYDSSIGSISLGTAYKKTSVDNKDIYSYAQPISYTGTQWISKLYVTVYIWKGDSLVGIDTITKNNIAPGESEFDFSGSVGGGLLLKTFYTTFDNTAPDKITCEIEGIQLSR